jgi:predicted protein tyrosine phosphatase
VDCFAGASRVPAAPARAAVLEEQRRAEERARAQAAAAAAPAPEVVASEERT